MSAPKGNKFWLQRSSHGRKPIFATPDDLWSAACEYFEWVESNPLQETKAFHFQGAVITDTVPKMRAMTIVGLCFFLGISRQGWSEYKQKEDFSYIVDEVESVIYSQKLEGAAADLLNASIISRELGLADKSEVKQEVSVTDLTDEQIEKRLQALQNEEE